MRRRDGGWEAVATLLRARARAAPPLARLGALMFCALILVAPRAATGGARAALDLWWTRLVPALLPFLLAAEAYLWGSLAAPREGPAARLAGRLTRLPTSAVAPLLAAFVGGYPTAAALADRWVRAGRLSRGAAARVVALGSVPDPLFVAALWAPTMGRAHLLPLVLLALQYLSLVPVLVYLRGLPPADDAPPAHPARDEADPLLAAALGAARTLLLVAVSTATLGAVAAVARSLLHTWTAWALPPIWREVGVGGLDALLLAEPSLPIAMPLALVATSTLAALGGAVLWLETWAITRPSGLDLRPFVAARLLQAATAAVLAAVAVALWGGHLARQGLPALALAPPVAPWRLTVAMAAALFGALLLAPGRRRPTS